MAVAQRSMLDGDYLRSRLTGRDVALFTLLVAVLATLWGYYYGDGDQIEQLPIVMRALDSSYLARDFFTNATAAAGPRLYYAQGLAALSHLLPLPLLFLLLTLASNWLLAVVTVMAVRTMFGGSNAVAMLACCAVMSVDTFGLGYDWSPVSHRLTPGTIALPLAFLAVWLTMRERPVPAALSAGLATLVHPLMGLETGGILLFVWAAQRLLAGGGVTGAFTRSNVLTLLKVIAILAVSAGAVLAPEAPAAHISTDRFIQIVAVFRHPHHYLPSSFPKTDYLQAAAFLIASAIAWRLWRATGKAAPAASVAIVATTVAVLVLCLGGFLFVEVFPSRLWTTAQTFRLLILVKWLGVMLVAGSAAARISEKMGQPDNTDEYLSLAAVLTPLAMVLSQGALWLRSATRTRVQPFLFYLGTGPVTILIIAALLLQQPSRQIVVLFSALILMALSLVFLRSTRLAHILNIAATVVLVLLMVGVLPFVSSRAAGLVPRAMLELADYRGDMPAMAGYAQANTPDDALFLTPPDWGQFRLLARRAIVVDFKAFPFEDDAMVEWRQRLLDCYGSTASSGFRAESEMDASYVKIQDPALLDLAARYGFGYAVLHVETVTSFPVLYRSGGYKLVALAGDGP